MPEAAFTAAPPPWRPPSPLPEKWETDRLTIRWYRTPDATALFDAVNTSRGHLLPWLPWCRNDYHKVEDAVFAIEWFRRWGDGGHDDAFQSVPGYVLGVFLRADGTLVGGTGFNRLFTPVGTAETGYWTDIRHVRRGYCAEATRGMISWGFTPQSQGGWGFRRIHIFASAQNTASCNVPRSIGLHQCQHARADRWVEGVGLTDSLGWDVLPEEWNVAAQRKAPA